MGYIGVYKGYIEDNGKENGNYYVTPKLSNPTPSSIATSIFFHYPYTSYSLNS